MKPSKNVAVDIEARNNTHINAFWIAARNSNVYAVKKLIDLGVDVNAGDRNACTALHYAVPFSNVDIRVVEELVRGGACVNATSFPEDKPIHSAVNTCSTAAVDWLISNGAVLRGRNRFRDEVIDLAIYNEMWNVVDKVLSAERSERMKSRVSLVHHIADRIDCLDCLNRLNKRSPDLGNAVTQIKESRENVRQLRKQQNTSNCYLLMRYEHISKNH